MKRTAQVASMLFLAGICSFLLARRIASQDVVRQSAPKALTAVYHVQWFALPTGEPGPTDTLTFALRGDGVIAEHLVRRFPNERMIEL